MKHITSAAVLVALAGVIGLGCASSESGVRYRATTFDERRSAYGGISGGDSGDSDDRSIEVASEDVSGEYEVVQAQYEYDQSTVVSEMAAAPTTMSTSTGSGSSSPDLAEPAPPREPPQDRYAQAQTQRTTPEATATDAVDTSGELLIYTALFHVGVYDVEAAQATIASTARATGGFVSQQADDRIVVRVPAAQFRAFLETVEGVGDVLHRELEAQDVGEEFRDVEIRIRNLEAVRDRIAELLERGLSVEQVLVVERELERVTSELERMRGRQRYLADRIAYSTVTVLFRPAPREAIDQPDVFQLPFSWLDSLGLSNLLDLR